MVSQCQTAQEALEVTVVAPHGVPGAASMWDRTVSHVYTFATGAGQYEVRT